MSEEQASPESSSEFKQWECVVCGFVYDEAAGIPEDGIAPGTRWEDIPDDWECPECGASKFDFDPAPIEDEPPGTLRGASGTSET